MAVRMHQHAVLDRILAPMGSPQDVVVVPPRHRGDLLVANRTDPALFLPEQPQRPSAHQGSGHLHAETFFEVRFPGGVVGIRFPLDLDMPLDRRARSGQEPDRLDGLFPAGDRAVEDPMPSVDGLEVAVLDPSSRLLGMPPLGPLRVLARLVRSHTIRSKSLGQRFLRLSHQTTVWRDTVPRFPGRAVFPTKCVSTTRLRNQNLDNSAL